MRALAHLLLALAFLAGTAAQARTVACAAMSASAPSHHGHEPSSVSAVHAHGDPAAERPLHERATCQALCCLVAAELPAPAPTTRRAASVEALRYPLAADPAFGRKPAPEPGIPKHRS